MARRRRERPRSDWTRYAAPAAFLLGVTVAVLLIRSGLEGAGDSATATRPAQVATRPATTAAKKKPKRRPPRTTTARAEYYTVVAGDTFAVIASKAGTTVAELERLNPGVRSTSLHIGQRIRVK